MTSKGNEKGKTFRKIYEFIGEDSFRWSPYTSERGTSHGIPQARHEAVPPGLASASRSPNSSTAP